jgi:hypothetical protein
MNRHKKMYITNAVWLTLMTFIEVVIFDMNIPRNGLVALLLAITVTKMILVAMIYMHLKYETKVLRRLLLLPIPLALIFLWSVVYDLSFTWTFF